MASATGISKNLRRVVVRIDGSNPTDVSPTDGELLLRYRDTRDDVAFATLVRRHAGMVLGTCRRILRNEADADDAFQASFLVVLRKSESLSDRICIGNWLYGVAYHTALKARAMAATRKQRESMGAAAAPKTESEPDREALAILDTELQKLPEKYREPLVLCDLEGVSRREAATRLAIPEGTVSSRLATAHTKLAERLKRRGVLLSAAGFAAMLAGVSSGSVPARRIEQLETAATGTPSPNVAALTREITQMMLLKHLRTVMTFLVLGGVTLGIAAGLMPASADEKGTPKNALKDKPKADPTDLERMQGVWKAINVRHDGAEDAKPVNDGFSLRIEGKTLSFNPSTENRKHTIELHPGTTPKGLDLTPMDGPAVGKKLECGIYEFAGETLKLAIDKEGESMKRPVGFETKIGDGVTSFVFRKVVDEKKPVAKGAPAEEPKWKADFRRDYGLRDGELIKRVPFPFPESRAVFFREQIREFCLRNKLDVPEDALKTNYTKHFSRFIWRGNWIDDHFTAQTTPIDPEVGVTLERLLDVTLGYAPTRILDPDNLAKRSNVTGDYVVRFGAEIEKIAPELEAILRANGLPRIRLKFQDVEEDVFVLAGTYESLPVENRKVNQIELYAKEIIPNNGSGGGSGSLIELSQALERFVRRPIAMGKIDQAPKRVSWYFNVRSPMLLDPANGIDTLAEDTNAEDVLRNLVPQTGLTATLEKRKIRKLVITGS